MVSKPLKKQPKQRRSQEIVKAVLEGATRILSKIRLQDATTTRIAEAAGVSVGSLYDYFPNKESIAVALIDDHLKQVTAKFEELLAISDGKTPLEIMENALDGIFSDLFARRTFLHEIFLLAPESGRIQSLFAARQRSFAILEAFLLRRLPERGSDWAHLKAFTAVYASLGMSESYIMQEQTRITSEQMVGEVRLLLRRVLELE